MATKMDTHIAATSAMLDRFIDIGGLRHLQRFRVPDVILLFRNSLHKHVPETLGNYPSECCYGRDILCRCRRYNTTILSGRQRNAC